MQMALPRFSYHMYSVVVGANQLNSYYKDQMQFVDACHLNFKISYWLG